MVATLLVAPFVLAISAEPVVYFAFDGYARGDLMKWAVTETGKETKALAETSLQDVYCSAYMTLFQGPSEIDYFSCGRGLAPSQSFDFDSFMERALYPYLYDTSASQDEHGVHSLTLEAFLNFQNSWVLRRHSSPGRQIIVTFTDISEEIHTIPFGTCRRDFTPEEFVGTLDEHKVSLLHVVVADTEEQAQKHVESAEKIYSAANVTSYLVTKAIKGKTFDIVSNHVVKMLAEEWPATSQ